MLFALLSRYAPALAALNMASVAMIGGSEKRAIRRPFTSPQNEPAAIPAAQASQTFQPWFTARTPITTPQSPTSDPTEISIPPVAITSVIPAATIATSAPLLRITDKLSAVRNPGKLLASHIAVIIR